MKFRLLFLFLFFASIHMHALQVIILMGPSCAGKSTLSKYLCAQLNTQNEKWEKVDFDEVEEDIERLIAVTNNCLEQNSNVIVDTNMYEYGMENKINGAVIIKVIVTAPLEVLLQRYEKRMQCLQLGQERAFRARLFVINSFKRSLYWPCDFRIDTSQQSIKKSGDMIFDFLKVLEK